MNMWFESPRLLMWIMLLVMITTGIVVVLLFRLPKKIKNVLENLSIAQSRESSETLNAMADRLLRNQSTLNENLRSFLSNELNQLRSSSGSFQVRLIEEQSVGKEKTLASITEMRNEVQAKLDLIRSEVIARVLEKLSEQSRAEREIVQSSLKEAANQLNKSMETLSKVTDSRLEQISGKVNERLEEGFKKTNATFVSVMERLATIDEAQKKIDGLTTNVIGLQELLGDKRSRGAFGEVQLENLVRNMLPPSAYDFQFTYSTGSRVDCILRLPDPTGNVSVDSKFPLENYHRMFSKDNAEGDKALAQRAFRVDIRKHVDAISDKYIIDGETSDEEHEVHLLRPFRQPPELGVQQRADGSRKLRVRSEGRIPCVVDELLDDVAREQRPRLFHLRRPHIILPSFPVHDFADRARRLWRPI